MQCLHSLVAVLVQLLADLVKHVRMEATIDHLLKDADVMTKSLRKFGSHSSDEQTFAHLLQYNTTVNPPIISLQDGGQLMGLAGRGCKGGKAAYQAELHPYYYHFHRFAGHVCAPTPVVAVPITDVCLMTFCKTLPGHQHIHSASARLLQPCQPGTSWLDSITA